ncbi:uncharacterized protein LOC141686784 isoform X2 [Apium graveolens]|uniref:uncharacterized protein LOC141686784 isoform X2 n=1 Tax=Apium graveolens TaxID=4045 RepID=UPI003D7B5956
MKEVTYNHLLLKNFPTLQDDGASHSRKYRRIDSSVKENNNHITTTKVLPSIGVGFGNQNHMSTTNSQCTHGSCPVSFSKSCLECDKLETLNVSNVTHYNVKAATSNTLGYFDSTPISKLPGKSRSSVGATPPRVPFSDMINKCPTAESKLGKRPYFRNMWTCIRIMKTSKFVIFAVFVVIVMSFRLLIFNSYFKVTGKIKIIGWSDTS